MGLKLRLPTVLVTTKFEKNSSEVSFFFFKVAHLMFGKKMKQSLIQMLESHDFVT